jgi:hypothetical protein
MVINPYHRKVFTNIAVFNQPHIVKLEPDHIITKELVKTVKKKDGSAEAVFGYKLNIDFWKQQKEPISIVLDEFHNICNSRAFMSKKNQIFNKWLTMIRRVLGSAGGEYGELVLISQLSNQVDVIARELCHQVRFHRCNYVKQCHDCGCRWTENSDMPIILWECPECASIKLKKTDFDIEIWMFEDIFSYKGWKEFGLKTYFRHYHVWDVEELGFPYYSTMQWDNLFEDY